jgi:hypothetical protein
MVNLAFDFWWSMLFCDGFVYALEMHRHRFVLVHPNEVFWLQHRKELGR